MKQCLCLAILATVMTIFCAVCLAACGSSSLKLDYFLNQGGESFSVSGIGTCTDTDIIIPAKYKGLPVTNIRENAFSGCSLLTNITIPDSVTSIGKNAFYDCRSLTSITIPDSVTSIGENAFFGCSKLVEVCNFSSLNITRGSTSNGCVAYYALNVYTPKYSQSNLKTTKNNYIFYEDGANVFLLGYTGTKTKLTLPDTFNGKYYQVYDYAFYFCSLLTSVTIPDGVTSIGKNAFYDCRSLTNITIPDSVTNIGDSAFYYCRSLTSITIPVSVTNIGNSAFYSCRSLTSITIPDGLTSIGNSAFSYCSSLTSVTISDSVTSIGENAFYGCSSLKSITIPDGMTSIGNSAFSGCSSLTNVTIPDGVTNIGNYAFFGCCSLTNITIPDSVKSIGKYTFCGCNLLTSVMFENTDGWRVFDSSMATSGTSIASSALSHPSTAATCLASSYYHCYWLRS